MLCDRCEKANTTPGSNQTTAGPLDPQVASRLRDLLCERCGAVLPPTDPTETMLEKLSQLARFGLTAEGRPLLERRAVGTNE